MAPQTPYQKKWIKDNPDKVNEYQKIYREKNKQKLAIQRRERYLKTKVKSQETNILEL
jgi:hypothetical protein